MTHPEWKIGTLRASEYGYDFGHILFYRLCKQSRPLSVGPTYWVKFQGSNQVFSFAESYSGVNLSKLVAPIRDSKGSIRSVPPEVSAKLQTLLRTFITNLPAGARPKPNSDLEADKKPLKRTTALGS